MSWGCGTPPPVRAPGSDFLGEIRIEGNLAIETGALVPALALHQAIEDGAAIDPFVLAADADRIRAAYLKRGFFEATVATRVERRGEHAQLVVFTVVEGRRATTRVEIIGLPPEIPAAEARALVGLDDGEPFHYSAYDAAKPALAALVENAGYAHVVVRATVIADPAAARATARYEIAAGPRTTFGAIRVSGVRHPALIAAVRARLRFATGEPYSVAALVESQAAIYDIGRFSSVQLVADRAGQRAVVDVDVALSEANRREIHAGFGLGREPESYEGRLRGGFGFVPAGQPLLTLAMDAQLALTLPHDFDGDELEPKLRGTLSAQRLDLFVPRLRGSAEIGANYQTVEAYTWIGAHARLGLGATLGARWLQLGVGWLLAERTFPTHDDSLDSVPPGDPNSPACRLGVCGGERVGAFQASLVADLRDNPIEPRRGIYLDLRAAKGTRLAGGERPYLQLTPELRAYVSFARFVLATRVRVGTLSGDVPVTERYYSGGTVGQRGFSDRRLSPRARDCVGGTGTVVVGGGGLVETGAELRRQLGTLWGLPLGANLFVDGGDVQCTPLELDASELAWAAGAGVWAKLVGDLKIRVDLGYRLNSTPLYPRSTDGDRLANTAFHIGVGDVY